MKVLLDDVAGLLDGAGLLTAVGGGNDSVVATDTEYRLDPQLTVELLADGLRLLHDAELAGVDVPERQLVLADVVSRADERVRSGIPLGLDPAYSHLGPTRLLEILADGAESLGDVDAAAVVLTHGSPEAATLLCASGRTTGFIGWESAEVADRHRDLAHAATWVASSLGPMLVPVFFERYGTHPDPVRLDWWALAAQLTGTAPTSRPEPTSEQP